jgi:hypothetical protein
MSNAFDALGRRPGPGLVLAALLAGWLACGLWIVGAAPYASGTDESIRYVAFAAARNRWATADDHARYGIEHYYYPPLYYLLLAPFFGDRPEFAEAYPGGEAADERYLLSQGGERLVSDAYLAGVPPSLWRLYRAAKGVSLACGLAALLAMAGTVAILFPGPLRWWLALGATAPWILLPQFLYYQTLVNNDALVNALSAVAILLFTLGATSPAGSRGRRALWGVPVAVGLGILTKPSALALAPLCLGAAALPLLDGPGATRRGRLPAFVRTLLAQGAIILAAGGWWLVRGALQGDPFGFDAQRAAHGWAVLDVGLTFEPSWWIGLAARMSRSFIGQFAGRMIGIPDRIFLLYLAIPAVMILVSAAGPLFGARRAGGEGVARNRRFVLLCLGLVAAVNFVSAVVYTHRFFSPYGRLFFPALAAWSALLAWWLNRLAERRRKVATALIALLVLHASILFGWTLANRMIDAVVQPRERLVPLAYRGAGTPAKYVGPIWSNRISQPVSLPPGRLLGFRVQILRTVVLPQFGSVVRARLDFAAQGGASRGIDLVPFPLGENDACDRWTELRLAEPVDLAGETTALLGIEATPPAIFARIAPAHFLGVTGAGVVRSGAGTDRGRGLGCSLAVTALYDPGGA